ncbi:MAG TPA: aldose epimerase family protein [Pyrinomonadaceae bacterium]|jgi:aldose 1-epimerase
MMNKAFSLLILCLCLALSGGFGGERKAAFKVQRFGNVDGKAVSLYTLTNRNGVEARITNYGGIILSLRIPDRAGRLDDVVLGYDGVGDYVSGNPKYMGAIIGRFGNRIARGRFTLNGVEYKLVTNSGENHLHGGVKGFDKALWDARALKARGSGVALELSYLSRDGEEHYPGNLRARVVYTLTDRDELKIDYSATTDKDTVINLTHHSYFNLAGQGNGDILNHQLTINATRFTPVDANLIPTGELRSVKGTPLDFTEPTAIGARINNGDEQLKLGNGYDHNFVLDGRAGTLRRVAEVSEPTTGRVMEVWTTEPGMQLYTGNYLDDVKAGKGGKTYKARDGFCLETQHFPDSPNRQSFPTTILRKGSIYRSTTVYKFSAR